MLETQCTPFSFATFKKAFFKSSKSKAPAKSNLKDFGRLSVVKKISDTKFPIYLVSSSVNNQNYVVKTFKHSNEDPKTSYKNEIRNASLKHPNLISFVHHGRDKKVLPSEDLGKVPYVLMEYAPYGDLFDFIMTYGDKVEDKLIRTYFRQIIDAIEYIHENGIAHLDLKLENILIGADYNIKICDFDLSYHPTDAKIYSRGTKFYRAPEFFMLNGSSSTPCKSDISFSADIYSAGIILFMLQSRGFYPHNEQDNHGSINFLELMYQNNNKFWEMHSRLQGKESSFFESSFQDLFNGMTSKNSKERMTIKQIKNSEWYNQPVYTPAELSLKMKQLLNH